MLRKRKSLHYYDTETCTFEKAPMTFKRFALSLGKYLGVASVVCIVVFFFVGETLSDKKQEILKSHLENTEKLVIRQNQTLDGFENFLDQLYNKDNELYTAMLQADEIAPAIWEGGRGGSDRYNLRNATLRARTELRFEALNHRVKLLNDNYHMLDESYDKLKGDLNHMPAIVPVKGLLISGFGNRRHPIVGGTHFHTGLDFKCPTGTPIYATGDGKVIFATYKDNGYGIHVDIDHQNDYETKYAHMSQLVVSEGQMVKRGDLLGYSGNTGMSTGPHLHYEIKYKGEKIDPLDFYYADLSPGAYLKMRLTAANQDAPILDY